MQAPVHLVWHSLTKGWCWNKRPPKKDHPTKVGQPYGLPGLFFAAGNGRKLPQSKPDGFASSLGEGASGVPETLQFIRQLSRHVKGPISEEAGIEQSEMTGGVSSAARFPHAKTARPPRSMGQSGWKFILRASCWRGLPQRVLRRPHPADASCRRGSAPRWAG